MRGAGAPQPGQDAQAALGEVGVEGERLAATVALDQGE